MQTWAFLARNLCKVQGGKSKRRGNFHCHEQNMNISDFNIIIKHSLHTHTAHGYNVRFVHHQQLYGWQEFHFTKNPFFSAKDLCKQFSSHNVWVCSYLCTYVFVLQPFQDLLPFSTLARDPFSPRRPFFFLVFVFRFHKELLPESEVEVQQAIAK